jgi:uncharacterized membrane protein YozB (DUF420 family)
MIYAHRWSIALTLVVAGFLAFSLPPYFTADPGRSRVPATFPLHYPVLVGHVMLASIAMVAVVIQCWPGLRARRPGWHRRVGRVYVATALPAAGCATVIGVATPFGPILAVSNVVLAALWLWFTANGYLAGRRRHVGAHRRSMIFSATLALSVIANRIWSPVLYLSLQPLQDSLFGGNEQHYLWMVAGLSGWMGWTLPLFTVWWWQRRRMEMAPPTISQLGHTSRV